MTELDELPRENRTAIYRAMRYGPVYLAMAFVGGAMLAFRLAAEYFNVGIVRLGGLDVVLIAIGTPTVASVAIVTNAFFAWAVHPSRAQLRLRGTLALLAILPICLFVISGGEPANFVSGRWDWGPALYVTSAIGMSCIPLAIVIIAWRLASFAYREYWR